MILVIRDWPVLEMSSYMWDDELKKERRKRNWIIRKFYAKKEGRVNHKEMAKEQSC